jgi:hypothetical protein
MEDVCLTMNGGCMLNDTKDRREGLGSSVADFEAGRAKNLHGGWWACVCGSRKFHLQQQALNVKTFCTKCGNCDIIYWNGRGKGDPTSRMRLDGKRVWLK